jgi:trehalose 6-phosphate synthase
MSVASMTSQAVSGSFEAQSSKGEKADLHLPTVNVISFAGPGTTGGVAASLEPVIKRLGTRVNWFALTNNPQTHSNSATTGFAYHTAQIPERAVASLEEFAQGYLWDLFHGNPHRAKFDPIAWKNFRQLCDMVASECITLASESFPTICWLHDYQLALTSPILASQRGILLCQFWHVPFPKVEVLSQSPIGKEITQALLHNKLIGFHTEEYAANFIDAVAYFYPEAQIDRSLKVINLSGHQTRLAVMPLGVDLAYWHKLAMETKPHSEALARHYNLAQEFIIGIDKLDYTKGIIERLNGLEQFLDSYPQWQRRFHYVQLSQPNSTQASPAQKQYENDVDNRINEINQRFARDNWQPILHIKEHLGHKKLAAWYQATSALSINSLSDGLNLLAKEFVACRHDELGVLILSQNTGAACELQNGALLVNPRKKDELAKAFNEALTLSWEEKRSRMLSLRHAIGWNQLISWALGFLGQALAD